MPVADRLGRLDHATPVAVLFPTRGHPADAPARLARATVLPGAEGRSDRQAADAVRSRIDWNYGLGLAVTAPGFHQTVLSACRTRLIAGEAAPLRRDARLPLAQAQGLLNVRGRHRTDATPVLAAMRGRNRRARVGETLRAALNTLAVVAPAWGQTLAPPAGYARESHRVEHDHVPKTEAARQAFAAVRGAAGQRRLPAIDAALEPPWWPAVPALQTRRRVWAAPSVEVNGTRRWRAVQDRPSPAELIASPDDPEARYSTKREVEWVGSTVQRTETCATDTPQVIVPVETTPATTPDEHRVERVQASLAEPGLRPAEHWGDQGYTDAPVLVESPRTYEVTLIGPVADDPRWPARPGTGLDTSQFLVHGERQVVTCPMGKQRLSWLPHSYPKHGMTWEVRVARTDCTPCPHRAPCTRAQKAPRLVGLQAREPYEARQEARPRQTTDEFRQQYAPRAGIESAHAQRIRRCGLRHARYVGLANTHLPPLATAAALNFVRLGEWLTGTPRAKTRGSPFAALKAA
jgi:transposase